MADTWDGPERRSGQKRRTKRRYRFIDRRLGFDRRRRYPVLGTMRDNPWILVGVIVLLNVLSLVEGLFTLAELGLGIARGTASFSGFRSSLLRRSRRSSRSIGAH